MSRQSKTNNYAYAAGLVDSDGCIQIKRHVVIENTNMYRYSLAILTNMCDGEAIDYLKGVFGGNVFYTRNYSKDNSFRLPVFRWEITGKKAKEFLKRILPFLRIKKTQAQLAIRFQEHVDSIGFNKFKPLSGHEYKFREEVYNEMKRLKTIHNPSVFVAATTERENSSKEGMLQSDLTGIITVS